MEFDYYQIQINPQKIAFLKFIIEGYDGLAVVTTIDRKDGLVRLAYPVSRKNELYSLIEELFPESSIEIA